MLELPEVLVLVLPLLLDELLLDEVPDDALPDVEPPDDLLPDDVPEVLPPFDAVLADAVTENASAEKETCLVLNKAIWPETPSLGTVTVTVLSLMTFTLASCEAPSQA